MKIRSLATVCVLVLAMAAASPAVDAQAIPGQLGVSDERGREDLLSSLTTGRPIVDAASKAFLALPASARAAVVQASFAWMKAVADSAPFKASYAQVREANKPAAPGAPASVDAELKRRQEEQARQAAEATRALATLPAAQRAEMEAVLRASQAQMNTPEMVALQRQQIEVEQQSAREEYDEDVKRWEAGYPANPLVLVARRLQMFLDVSADVDFAARTETRDGRVRFVNPDYEAKPADWKMCFRAGREAVTAARTAATAWLRELPQP